MQPVTLPFWRRPWAAALVASLGLAACGGGNPLGNPDSVDNPSESTGQKLSFRYFQKCVNPIFRTAGCDAGGCHDNTNGTGGALRVEPNAALVDLTNAANTPDVVRGTDMYKNFYSAQGEVVFGAPEASRLVNKPLVRNVLHGGGVIFDSVDEHEVKVLQYWITHPMPQGQDEFSTAGDDLFTPPATGDCNIQ
jgi:hypothetical protein